MIRGLVIGAGLCSLLMVFSPLASAETAEEKGTKIARLVEKKNSGFVGENGKMKMVLIDAHGTKTTREMNGKVKEVKDDGDKSISIFQSPSDVKGTKMLTWSHKEGDDDQWLYLPSLRRVKRISSRNKSASFMGSEFSYEDLGSQEVEKYNHKWLKDSKVKKSKVWVLERVPKAKSGYSKQLIYMSKKYHNPLRIEYFDRKGELLKIANFSEFKKYTVKKKDIWRANKIHMKNVQTQKQSTFTWNKRKLGVKFKNSEFDKRKLK